MGGRTASADGGWPDGGLEAAKAAAPAATAVVPGVAGVGPRTLLS
jgi:hypothetical protein